ncbi:MAG: hypothetical protein AAB834_04355, partial [Patescibacteria group bacterium]
MSSPNIVTPDKWFAGGMNGDVLLCDPFTGIPLRGRDLRSEPTTAPDVFTDDVDLGGGYGIWRGSYYMNGEQPVEVGVLLTEPSDPNGLGTLADLRENMGHFAVVGYANKRSIRREATIRQTAQSIGSVTIGGEIVPDDSYMSMLYDVAGELNRELFSFDPDVDIEGNPVGRTALAMQKIEEALR